MSGTTSTSRATTASAISRFWPWRQLTPANERRATADGLCVAVEDDGPGIAEAARAAVLARGVRMDETVPGSGLGLAIVDELAQLYGGQLRLDRKSVV